MSGTDDQGRMFPCDSCGADFEFNIGAQSLKCPFCGYEKEIEFDDEAGVEEQDLEEVLRGPLAHASQASLGDTEVRCSSCGANVAFSDNLVSTECPYCGSPLQRSDHHESEDRLAVNGVLPFMVDRDQAKGALGQWVKSRWFAPNEFKKRGVGGKFSGIYFPHWTYDSMTHTRYSGQRGEHYWVEVGSGDNKRRERRTRWYPASGNFSRFFDDVLVCAAKTAAPKLMRSLEPWPLSEARPYAPEVLAGYLAMTYDVLVDEGLDVARERMNDEIRAEAKRRIGGDEQRIHGCYTKFGALSFKHLLLPVWMMAYRYREKSYQLVVNACTGEVQGERPWSWVKISMAALAGLAALAGIAYAKSAGS